MIIIITLTIFNIIILIVEDVCSNNLSIDKTIKNTKEVMELLRRRS